MMFWGPLWSESTPKSENERTEERAKGADVGIDVREPDLFLEVSSYL